MFIYHPVDSRTATRGSYFASQIIYVSMYKSFASGKQNHSPSCNHKNQSSGFIPGVASVRIGNGRVLNHAKTSRRRRWRDEIIVRHVIIKIIVQGFIYKVQRTSGGFFIGLVLQNGGDFKFLSASHRRGSGGVWNHPSTSLWRER
jgi:hypothetical protein